MATKYATPGVYIEEVTGPGVIAGVGTSTPAFIGPALRGPLNEPYPITSFDEFIEYYGGTRAGRAWPYLFVDKKPYYMAFGVEGFFTNGGQECYIVRVGTAVQASLDVKNDANEVAFTVQALQDGKDGDEITVESEQYVVQEAATGSAVLTAAPTGAGKIVTVDDPNQFREGDFVAKAAGDPGKEIDKIQGSTLTLKAAIAGLASGDTLRIADVLTPTKSIRMNSTEGLNSDDTALLSGDDADNPGTAISERVTIKSVDPTTNLVTLKNAPTKKYNMLPAAATALSLTSIRVLSTGKATVIAGSTTTSTSGTEYTTITVSAADAAKFRPGDVIDHNNKLATISSMQSSGANYVFTLDRKLAVPPAANDGIRIADIIPGQTTFRVEDATGLYPGTVVLLQGDDANNTGNTIEAYLIVQNVDGAGFVTLESTPKIAKTFNLKATVDAPILIPQEFRLIVTPPTSTTSTLTEERFENLSLNPYHPRYVFNTDLIESKLVALKKPTTAPSASGYKAYLISPSGPSNLAGGADDQPSGLTSVEYQDGLKALRDVDDVNLICIPDAAAHPERKTIQKAMITHCLTMLERFAILDSEKDMPPSGTNSVRDQRQEVQSTRGFAALYYPWLEVRDPTSTRAQARTMYVPPSGHMAGVYARTDDERGVHKAPANTDVRGVLGLERLLSDRQQGPLNLAGVNVLRIFPGSGQVTVWGARTTVDPTITDWLYVPIRRLMLYLEESIQEGIRWAVFEPNNLELWGKLKRTISEFLTRVWRSGALFGESADKAFYVRIDEALNPDSTRKLGRLYIEIGVRPSYPAEFIIVRIGLWDGGAEISES